MANNYFFTGEKGIGKSTLINLICNRLHCRIAGFRTVRHISVDGRISFHILDASKNDEVSDANFLFYRGEMNNDITNKFNKYVTLLDDYENFDVIVMDEIGSKEEKAEIFKNKIREILDSSKLVLGVIQKVNSDFLDEIKSRKDVKLLVVNEQNRDMLSNRIIKVLEE